MELYAEIKLMGDGYAGGFTSGMSMSRSETIEGFSTVSYTHLTLPTKA